MYRMPHALRAMELMPGAIDEMHGRVAQVERVVAYGLHGIGMEDRIKYSLQRLPTA